MELICPECKRLNEKSQLVSIFMGYGTSGYTNSYIDENGQSHYHDPNPHVKIYRCSSGHELAHVTYTTCHVCINDGQSGKIKEDKLEVVDGFGFL